jgi:DNA repair protein RecN (Recombination protein N)
LIESLRIQQLAIVEEAELEFGSGLNVLTGETGAGKSIVLGALALLVGARASADTVRAGAEQGLVEALFRTDCHPEVEGELEARGLAAEDHELVVSRSVARNGRSRARVAGQLVPSSTLGELFAGRIEISSQHSSQSLLKIETHGRLLDAAGDLLPLRELVGQGVVDLRALDAELVTLRAAAEERIRRQDFLAFQLREIDEARLERGELERLTAEHARLAHAGRIQEEAGAALGTLVGDAGQAEVPNAADLLASALRKVEGLAQLDPGLHELAERLGAQVAELRDAAADLERYLDGVEVDPIRLSRLEERMEQVERLRRKYGDAIDQILAFREGAARELERIEGADQRVELLERRRVEAAAALERAAARLSEGRAKAAAKLARRVQRCLRDLSMPDARFEVALNPAPSPEGVPCTSSGAETPEFRFAANRGEPLRSLRRVASGGELSRVFLAVTNALRQTGLGMVLVFDEVDAGIGGGAAERVGRTLAELAAHHQVLCITHLPQIAAFADAHFRVEKSQRGGRTRARVARISGDQQIEEIARMAGGQNVTKTTRQHAEELLRSRSLK